MYFVDRQKIEEILNHMEKIMEQFEELSFQNYADYLVLERISHITAETIIDVGNMMIDGFIMRDPGSYHDIIDILLDEKVLPYDQEDSYKQFIQLRKEVVQGYLAVNHQSLIDVWKKHRTTVWQFPEKIKTYLNDELGPVSAFSNKE
ncbi:DUF86 domain-containing protein [Halobacillus salinarum]|uniref:DUF86 domain-containing protein n=1 Tax=Halobacillus salinarum TaxID=2932257 RepID=A0ABY4ENK7_9BACI|nr:DUF86 domain-containing protein [Halobacillus salinarum]UOQ46044.1 DUF86 domain-containing protein [Halobacillus salinarum]